MFKFLRYLTVCAVAVSSLAFTACSGDNDDEDQNPTTNNGDSTEAKTIVGTWSLDSKNTKTSFSGVGEKTAEYNVWKSFTFKADGNFTAIDANDYIWNGKYTVNGSDLALTAKTEDGTVTIKKGVDVAIPLYGTDIYEMGLKAIMNKQDVAVNGDVMTLEQEISLNLDLSDYGQEKVSGVASVHGVYNRK